VQRPESTEGKEKRSLWKQSEARSKDWKKPFEKTAEEIPVVGVT